jgi:dephospho-CoA kinase
MVERFGADIVDGNQELIRPKVAEIVFSDPQALTDLNAIVHPAMQAEIAAQIGVHRGTDRIVVLDFPLLAENPRKDLNATIVVDVDPEIAISRVVAHRGMDEADARARVARQASREDRLAIATHVIDNSGDPAALEAKVSKVWADLLALAANSQP